MKKNNVLSEIYFKKYCLEYIKLQLKNNFIPREYPIFFNYTEFEKEFINQLKNEISNVTIKSILRDFHDSFDYFNENDERYFIKKYMEIIENKTSNVLNNTVKKMNKLIDHRITYLKEILNNINENKEKIEKEFSISNLEIKRIQMGQGDSHNNNKNATLIFLTNNSKLFYKPRQGYNDFIFFSILDNYIKSKKINFYIPKVAPFSTFTLSEYIKFEKLKNKKDAALYYYNFGVLSSFLYCLNTTDMHYENFIAKKFSPIPIDLETLFQTTQIQNGTTSSFKNEHISESILGTLIFDLIVDPFTDLIPNIGGIMSPSDIYQKEILQDENTDKMRLVKEEVFDNQIKNNLCKFNEKIIQIFAEKEQFLKGFESGYKYILNNKYPIVKFIKKFENKLNSRIILRPTFVYFNYLEAIKQPKTSNTLSDQEIFSLLEKSNFYDKTIYEVEKKSLENYDIPFFVAKFNSCSIFTGDNKKFLKNFFQISPKESLIKKFEKLSISDLNAQKFLIEMCTNSYEENYLNTTQTNTKDTLRSLKSFSNVEKGNVVNYKKLLKIDLMQEVGFLSPRYDSNALLAVTPMNIGLYEGLGGYLLVCELYKQFSKEDSCINIDAYDKLWSLYEIYPFDNLSIYYGKPSLFKFYLELGNLKSFDFNSKVIDEFIIFIRELLSKGIETQIMDYIGGLSGMLSLAIDYYDVYPNDAISKFIHELAKSIIKKLVKQNGNVYWVSDIPDCQIQLGFAHGITGINYSLSKFYSYLERNEKTIDKEMLKIINLTETTEDNLFNKEKNYWMDNRNQTKASMTWCNGVSGLLLGRLFIRKNLNQSLQLKDKKLINLFLEEYEKIPLDDSLCHGHAGNLLIIQNILKSKAHQNYKGEEFKTLEKKIKNYLKVQLYENDLNDGYVSHNVTSASLFLGKLGPAVALMSQNENINTPIILM